MTLSELLKDIIDTSKDRVKNPITGAFILTFLVYNRKPILYFLLSDQSVERRINVITKHYNLDVSNFLWPAFYSLCILITIPLINLGLSWLLKKPKQKSLELFYSEKNDKAERERDLQNKIAGNQELETLNDRIENLTKENSNLQNTITNIEKKNITQVRNLNRTIDDLNKQLSMISNDKKLDKIFQEEITNEDFEFLNNRIGKSGRSFIRSFPNNGYTLNTVFTQEQNDYLEVLFKGGFAIKLGERIFLSPKGVNLKRILNSESK